MFIFGLGFEIVTCRKESPNRFHFHYFHLEKVDDSLNVSYMQPSSHFL